MGTKDKTVAVAERAETAIAAPTAAPVIAGAIAAWDDDTDAMIRDKMPLLKIAYPGSIDRPDGAAMGDLYNNLTGDYAPSMHVVLLRANLRNAMLQKYDPKERKPSLCESDNATTPTGGAAPLPGPCRVMRGGRWVEACPALQWSTDASGKRVPPACTEIYALLLWDLLNQCPVVLSVKKTGAPAFRALKSQLKFQRARLAEPSAPDIPVNCLVPIWVQTVNHGTYWTPSFTLDKSPEKRIPVDQARMFAAVAEDLGAQLESMSAAEITQTEDDAPNGGGISDADVIENENREPLPF